MIVLVALFVLAGGVLGVDAWNRRRARKKNAETRALIQRLTREKTQQQEEADAGR